MIKRTFDVTEHPEHGTLGLCPSWVPDADPLEGLAAAHDILEHFPNDEGGVEGELMALGAMLWVRAKAGFFADSKYSVGKIIAGDMPDLYRHVAYESFTLTDPGRTRPLDDEEAEYACQEAAREGLKEVRSECSEAWTSSETGEEHPENPFLIAFCSDQTRERIVGWMRKGYRRAIKRYKGVDYYTLCNQIFKPIMMTADKFLEHAEEGMILEVSINLRTCDVTMRGGWTPDLYAEPEDQYDLEPLTLIY